MSTDAMLTQDVIIGGPDHADNEARNAAARLIDGGQFTRRQLVPVEPGVAALGLYFEQGRYTLIAQPLVRDELLEFAGLEVDILLQRLEQDYGLRMR